MKISSNINNYLSLQAKKDALRGVAVDYLAMSSKQSQVNIYLAVATDGKHNSGDNAISLRCIEEFCKKFIV